MAKLVGVPSWEVDRYWATIKPELERVEPRAHGDWDLEWMHKALQESKLQLWLSIKDKEIVGISVTKVKQMPTKRVCLIMVSVGKDIDSWVHHRNEIEPWAKENGCTEMEIIGRKGWKKKLPDYEERYTVLRKKI